MENVDKIYMEHHYNNINKQQKEVIMYAGFEGASYYQSSGRLCSDGGKTTR